MHSKNGRKQKGKRGKMTTKGNGKVRSETERETGRVRGCFGSVNKETFRKAEKNEFDCYEEAATSSGMRSVLWRSWASCKGV